MVDFPKEEIRILTFHEAAETTEPLAVLPLYYTNKDGTPGKPVWSEEDQ